MKIEAKESTKVRFEDIKLAECFWWDCMLMFKAGVIEGTKLAQSYAISLGDGYTYDMLPHYEVTPANMKIVENK